MQLFSHTIELRFAEPLSVFDPIGQVQRLVMPEAPPGDGNFRAPIVSFTFEDQSMRLWVDPDRISVSRQGSLELPTMIETLRKLQPIVPDDEAIDTIGSRWVWLIPPEPMPNAFDDLVREYSKAFVRSGPLTDRDADFDLVVETAVARTTGDASAVCVTRVGPATRSQVKDIYAFFDEPFNVPEYCLIVDIDYQIDFNPDPGGERCNLERHTAEAEEFVVAEVERASRHFASRDHHS